eukprot:scaffold8074_cov444-Prasinococcus_capsulatus_cf.AAC.1
MLSQLQQTLRHVLAHLFAWKGAMHARTNVFACLVVHSGSGCQTLRTRSCGLRTQYVPCLRVHRYARSLSILVLTMLLPFFPSRLACQMVMANKKALEIRPLLFVWNLLLCGFSLLSVINIGPTAMKTLLESPDTAICTDRVGWDPALARWRLYFVLSKVPEMMDSVWLVLKKRPVSFLQEYHHLTVMLYCWHVRYAPVQLSVPWTQSLTWLDG